jgi:hypothetical protein
MDACKAKQAQVKFVEKSKAKTPACDAEDEDGDDKELGASVTTGRLKPKRVGVNGKGETLKGFSEITFRKILFRKSFSIGVPVIQKLECNIRLAGMMGVQYGFAVDEKTLMVAMAQATPLINIAFHFSAFGKAGPFAGGLITKLTLADIALPVNAVIAPLALSMGYDISWKVKALIADIKAYVRGPGMRCKNKAGRDPGGRWLVKHKDRKKRIFIRGGRSKGKSKGKERGKRRMVLLSEDMGSETGNLQLSYPGISDKLNPTPAKALGMEYKYAVEHSNTGKTRLGESTKFIGGLKKLASNLAMPCLTTPCNLWWVPKICGIKCGIGKGCKIMKGEIAVPSLYKWPGITKGGSIITKNQKCVKPPPPQKPPAAASSDDDDDEDEDEDGDGDDKRKGIKKED